MPPSEEMKSMMVKAVFRGNKIHDDQSRRRAQRYRLLIRYRQESISSQWYMGQDYIYTTMPDGNALLRQGRDEVPDCTLSCPYWIMADCHRCCHYEWLRLPSSACDEILLQQTLFLTNDGSSRLLRDEPFSVPLQSVHVLVQKNWLSHDNQSLLTLII